MAKNQQPASIMHPVVAAARRDFLNGRITRREMMWRASMAGAGALALSALGGLKANAQATPEGTPAGAQPVGYSIEVPTDLRTDLSGAAIRMIGPDAASPDNEWFAAALPKFTEATGITVEMVPGEQSATDRLQSYRQQWAAESSEFDVFQIDVIWPGIIAPFAVDLTEAIGEQVSDFLPAIIENNTVDGQLVAIPWYTDAGLMYYRTDLFEKYGLTVPATWDELGTAATTIRDGELATNPNFIGYAWQGAAYEGLTCNGLEWQVSNGGGSIVDTDGNVTVNNEQAVAAFERARGWIDSGISPSAVVNWQEADTLNNFIAGNVAIARNWPYMYSSANAATSAVAGNVAVGLLPMGSGEGARNAATLGGWNMFVSRFSLQQEAAIELTKYLTSAGVQRSFAIEKSHIPTRVPVFEDPGVVSAQPFIAELRDVFTGGAVARPSTATGAQYAEVSQVYYQQLNQVLSGSIPAAEAAANMQADIENLLAGSGL
ncbi:MAG TPA: ABC transporter substrate-binding protein [Thermomicrobiales bacterium]|jgi:trehalose/maltose transport system substrate-binding protein|nr:ABC transporter substrate-binding protein [Thermomicrobiales bacterium]